MSRVICVVGKKRSGKDVISSYINGLDNYSVVYKLAQPIKEALNFACDDLSYEDIDGMGVDREKPLGYNRSQVVEIIKDCLEYNGIDYKDVEEFVGCYPEDSWSIRTLMQRYGTDLVCNKIDKMFWTDVAIKFISDIMVEESGNGKTLVVVPDVRQEWELTSLRELGSIIIHLERDTINNIIDCHSTESGLPASVGDYVVKNDGSLEELYEKVNKILLKENVL